MLKSIAILWPQLFVAFVGNLGPLCFGLHFGWFAPIQSTLIAAHTPLNRPLTDDESSWLASLPSIAIIAGMPFFGLILHITSRRTAVFLATIPHVVVFGALALTQSVLATMLLRFAAGFFAAGALVACPLFIGECVDDKRRGSLCGSSALFVNSGVAISCALGAYCTYPTLNFVCMAFPAICILSIPWLPESPVRLLSVGQDEKARASLLTLRGGTDVDEEFTVMISALNATKNLQKSRCGMIFTDRVLRSAFIIVFGIMTMQQLSGITPINIFMVEILRDISSVDCLFAAVVINIIQLISSALAPLMLMFTGRKTTLLASAWLMSLSLTSIAFSALFSQKTPFPAYTLGIFMFAYNLGLGSVPFVLLPELLPTTSRGLVVAIIGSWVGIICFVMTKTYLGLAVALTTYGCFAGFAIVSLFGTMFIHLCVFETKGLNSGEIFSRLRGETLLI